MKKDKINFQISIERNKLYLHTYGNDSVSARIDVTQVWNFAKDIFRENPELLK